MLHVLICMVADMVSRVLVKVHLRETRCLTQRQVVPSVHVQMSHVLVVLHVVKRPQMMDMYVVVETRIMQTKLGMVRVSYVRRVTVRILISSRVDCTVHVRISVRIKELNVDARTVTME